MLQRQVNQVGYAGSIAAVRQKARDHYPAEGSLAGFPDALPSDFEGVKLGKIILSGFGAPVVTYQHRILE